MSGKPARLAAGCQTRLAKSERRSRCLRDRALPTVRLAYCTFPVIKMPDWVTEVVEVCNLGVIGLNQEALGQGRTPVLAVRFVRHPNRYREGD